MPISTDFTDERTRNGLADTRRANGICDFLKKKFVIEKEGDNVIYFTSYLHLGHRGIIEMQNRPFENIQEMNQVLIQNYNAVIHKNDTVYILGDISHHLPMDRVNELPSKLNRKKILVNGVLD